MFWRGFSSFRLRRLFLEGFLEMDIAEPLVSFDDKDIHKALGQESRRSMRIAVKELETLRNNLAHTQDIIPAGWQRIVIACSPLDQNLEMIRSGTTTG